MDDILYWDDDVDVVIAASDAEALHVQTQNAVSLLLH